MSNSAASATSRPATVALVALLSLVFFLRRKLLNEDRESDASQLLGLFTDDESESLLALLRDDVEIARITHFAPEDIRILEHAVLALRDRQIAESELRTEVLKVLPGPMCRVASGWILGIDVLAKLLQFTRRLERQPVGCSRQNRKVNGNVFALAFLALREPHSTSPEGHWLARFLFSTGELRAILQEIERAEHLEFESEFEMTYKSDRRLRGFVARTLRCDRATRPENASQAGDSATHQTVGASEIDPDVKTTRSVEDFACEQLIDGGADDETVVYERDAEIDRSDTERPGRTDAHPLTRTTLETESDERPAHTPTPSEAATALLRSRVPRVARQPHDKEASMNEPEADPGSTLKDLGEFVAAACIFAIALWLIPRQTFYLDLAWWDVIFGAGVAFLLFLGIGPLLKTGFGKYISGSSFMNPQ